MGMRTRMRTRISRVLAVALLIFAACVSAFAEDYVEGEAIVVLKAPEDSQVKASNLGELRTAVDSKVRAMGASVQKIYATLSELDNSIFAHVKSETKTTQELIQEFEKRDDVLAVSPNGIKHVLRTEANDASFDQLWGLEKINAPAVWDETTGSENVYVAVIDSGFDRHTDLMANIATEYAKSFVTDGDWDYDPVGHGIHVAGTIGAVGNNGIGVVGVNWKIKIIPLRIGKDDGNLPDSAINSAIDYIAQLVQQGVKIYAVNMSYGGDENRSPSEIQSLGDRNVNYRAYRTLDKLNSTLMIMAAGNEGFEVGKAVPFDADDFNLKAGQYTYPASYTGLNNMIVVGATDSDDKAGNFTNWGEAVHVAAPGVAILSTYVPYQEDEDGEPGKYYCELNGTSMAVPHVTGMVGLLASKYPDATPSQIKAAILEGANSAINPVVRPFENKLILFTSTLSELDAISNDQTAISEWEEETSADFWGSYAKAEQLLKNYLQYSSMEGYGTAKVSKYGLVDVAKSMEILGEKIADDENANLPETPKTPETPETPGTTYTRSSSSGGGGCEIGFGIFNVLLCVIFIRKGKDD